MKVWSRFSPIRSLMLGILILASCGAAMAQHPWAMFRRNPTHSAVSQYGDPAPNLPAWKYQVGGGLSSPVIADNGDGTSTIYIGGGNGRPDGAQSLIAAVVEAYVEAHE